MNEYNYLVTGESTEVPVKVKQREGFCRGILAFGTDERG